MKKLLWLLLVMLTMLTGCQAEGALRGDHGSRGRSAPTAAPVVLQLPLMLERGDDEEYRAISSAAGGTVELCVKDRALFIRRGEKIIPVVANENRGVPDTYGNLVRLAQAGAMALGREGVVWSPDGKYFCIVNLNYVQSGDRWEYDPVLVDTETGDMFLLLTLPDVRSAEGGACCSAVFSEDGRYLYALMLLRTEPKYQLYRIDLETLQYESIMAPGYPLDAPALCMRRDGIVYFVTGLAQYEDSSAQAKFVSASYSEEGWKGTVAGVGAPYSFAMPRKLLYSRTGNIGLLLTEAQRSSAGLSDPGLRHSVNDGFYMMVDCLVPVRNHDDYVSLLESWWIPTLDAEKMETIRAGDWAEPVESYVRSVQIKNFALSPDGKYALLLCYERWQEKEEYALLLLHLPDLTLSRVKGLSSKTLSGMRGDSYMYWGEDGIYLGTSFLENIVRYEIK